MMTKEASSKIGNLMILVATVVVPGGGHITCIHIVKMHYFLKYLL